MTVNVLFYSTVAIVSFGGVNFLFKSYKSLQGNQHKILVRSNWFMLVSGNILHLIHESAKHKAIRCVYVFDVNAFFWAKRSRGHPEHTYVKRTSRSKHRHQLFPLLLVGHTQDRSAAVDLLEHGSPHDIVVKMGWGWPEFNSLVYSLSSIKDKGSQGKCLTLGGLHFPI